MHVCGSVSGRQEDTSHSYEMRNDNTCQDLTLTNIQQFFIGSKSVVMDDRFVRKTHLGEENLLNNSAVVLRVRSAPIVWSNSRKSTPASRCPYERISHADERETKACVSLIFILDKIRNLVGCKRNTFFVVIFTTKNTCGSTRQNLLDLIFSSSNL